MGVPQPECGRRRLAFGQDLRRYTVGALWLRSPREMLQSGVGSRGPCKGHCILWGHRWGVWFSPGDLSVPGHREALFLPALGASVAMSRPPMLFSEPIHISFYPPASSAVLGDWCDHPVFRLNKQGPRKLSKLPRVTQQTEGQAGTGTQSPLCSGLWPCYSRDPVSGPVCVWQTSWK